MREQRPKSFSLFVSCPINHSDRACCYLTLHIVLAAAGNEAGGGVGEIVLSRIASGMEMFFV